MARVKPSPSPTSPTQGPTAIKRFRRAVVALIVCVLAVLVGVATWGGEGIVWQDLSVEPTSPELHRTIRRLRGPLPLVYIEDAIEHARTGHAPPPCRMKTPTRGFPFTRQGCLFDPERAIQRHPHYTIRGLIPWDGAWAVHLEPRDTSMPLDANVLARFDLPNVALDMAHDDALGVTMVWQGALDDACALQAPGVQRPCSPHRITVHAQREGDALYVRTVELGFARSNRVARNHVPNMALPAHRAELVASNEGPVLHITGSEVGWTDALPRLDGSDLPQKTYPLEALREGRTSPLARELERITPRDKIRATRLGIPWEGVMHVMATRMTLTGLVVDALELAQPQHYSRFMVITSPQQAPSRPVNRAAVLRYVPFAYRGASSSAPPNAEAPDPGGAASQPALRVHIRMDGIDVYTRGVRLEPAGACPSDGPSLCIPAQDAQTMAADFERVREGDAKGDLAPTAALLEATLARYPWRALYNHAVSVTEGDRDTAKAAHAEISADTDVPLAAVVRATSVLYHRVRPDNAAGTACPTHIAEADWAPLMRPCQGPEHNTPVPLLDAFVLIRGQ